jgi:hypothetical protein
MILAEADEVDSVVAVAWAVKPQLEGAIGLDVCEPPVLTCQENVYHGSEVPKDG